MRKRDRERRHTGRLKTHTKRHTLHKEREIKTERVSDRERREENLKKAWNFAT